MSCPSKSGRVAFCFLYFQIVSSRHMTHPFFFLKKKLIGKERQSACLCSALPGEMMTLTVALRAASASDATAFVLDFLSASMFTSHLLSSPVVTGCVCVCEVPLLHL